MEHQRIPSVDIARGIVMMIMALDHVRDYMHVNSLIQNPLNLATTTPYLFFTRWITHICAPTFVFLAGTSAYLSSRRNHDIASTRKFLLTRGSWLIIVELTLVNFAMFFDVKYRTIIFEVIGAIGIGFIFLSFFLKLAPRWIAFIGIAIMALHGLFPLLPLNEGSMIKSVCSTLFLPGATTLHSGRLLLNSYPPIPWFGIMLCGFAAGSLFGEKSETRQYLFFRLSGLLALIFILLRFINIYGDPAPWAIQSTNRNTFLSFMNVSKYPPSFLFSLATISITFFLLAISEKLNNKAGRVAAIYGSVPLFYFVIHIYIIHLATIAMVLLQGYPWNELVFTNFQFGRPAGKSGIPLSAVYLVWISIVAALFPACKWYSHYKASHKQNKWLRYL